MLGWFSPLVLMGRAQRKRAGAGSLVLAYHKLGPAPPGTLDPFLYDTPARFSEQLGSVAAHGYVPGSLSDVLASTRRSAVTFDDGCVSVLVHGIPLLARHNQRAIQFLVAAHLGGRNEWDVKKGDVPEQLMNTEQVREWLAAGHSIGSHSMTHRNLRHLNATEAREEILGSKKSLEDLFGVAVRHFSYPYGSWNPAGRELVQEAGYETACTMDFGFNNASTPRFELKRVFPLSSSELLRKALHRLRWRILSPR